MMNRSTYIALFIVYWVGFLIRIILLNSSSFRKSFGNRVEISTPLTSWKRAVEGVSLWKQGANPYDGDVFHESPLALIVYEYILTNAECWIPLIFAVCDLVTAASLSCATKIYLHNLSRKEEKASDFPSSAEPLLLKLQDTKLAPFYVTAMYLLCPYSIASCAGKSTAVFVNLILSLFILIIVAGKWHIAAVVLAVLSYHSFYHINLLVPLLMYVHQNNSCGTNKIWHIIKLASILFVFCSACTMLILASHNLTGSWQFIWSTYGCILSVPDLTPNIGLFWYFFTEMFEHFRVFFLCTFQLNVFVYTTPLAIRLRKEPIFLLFIHLIIIGIFKSYPCIGDVAFYFSLLPLWSHLFHFMRQRFIVCCVLTSCTLLAPTLWYLWIYSGSANANFYFAITLAFNTGQVFLLTDILSAYIKREYYLENGIQYNKDGGLVLMRLQ